MTTTIAVGPFPMPMSVDQRRALGRCLLLAVRHRYPYEIVRVDATSTAPRLLGLRVTMPSVVEAVAR